MNFQKYWSMYVDMAFAAASKSHARRLRTGCLVVKYDQPISIGINGTPPGWEDNNCEDVDIWSGEMVTKSCVRHAEYNALSKLIRSTLSAEGAHLFVTHSPCLKCADMIADAGIERVIYYLPYRDLSSLDFLVKRGVMVEQYDSTIYGLLNANIEEFRAVNTLQEYKDMVNRFH